MVTKSGTNNSVLSGQDNSGFMHIVGRLRPYVRQNMIILCVNYVTSSRDPTLVEANVENYLCTAHAGPLSSSRYEVSTHID